MHWVSGGMSTEQQLVQAQQANEELRGYLRLTTKHCGEALHRVSEARKKHDALRKALEKVVSEVADTGCRKRVQEVLDAHQ